MKLAMVTTNGRVTIPITLRNKYSFFPGRKVKIETAENGIKLIPLITPEEIKANFGFMGTKGKLSTALMGEKLRERKL